MQNSFYTKYNMFVRPDATAMEFWVGDSDSVAEYAELSTFLTPDRNGVARLYETIDAAVGSCVASRGDVIHVLPGHTEALSDATSMLLDVAGITVRGMGAGAARPTITLDTATTATVAVSAANVTVENMIFTANFADVVAPFTLTAAGFHLRNCAFQDTATDMNFVYIVDGSAVASANNGLVVEGCSWISPDLVCESMVKLDEDNSDVVVADNFVQLGVNNNSAALMVVADGKSVFNLRMVGNRVFRLNTDTATGGILFHTNQSDNSGIVAHNFAQHADTAAELLLTASTGLGTFENFASGVAGASGYVLPARDS